MDAHRDVRIGLHGRQHQVTQERLTGVLTRTGRGLQDDRAAGFLCRAHDRDDLL